MNASDLHKKLKFIIDAPADKDFFKTHAPLAHAIANAITSNRGLKIVGILGRWGSGKSTIVKEVDAYLKIHRPDYVMFSYDAWLHQNDPLRRSFLESIAEHLWTAGLIPKEKWELELQKLSGSVDITNRYETPTVTPDAKLFFILILIFSGGWVFAKDLFKQVFSGQINLATRWGIWFSTMLMLSSIAIWLLRAIFNKRDGKPHSLFPPLLLNKEPSHVNIVTQKVIEATSIEFGRKFRDMMLDVTSRKKRLLIVIDNIDRLVDDEAMSLWASIRSLFISQDDSEIQSTETYHPVVLLPIDSKSLAKMFALGASTETGTALAQSFINKTFDVTFDVPTPVMSDWKSYVDHKLSYALGTEFNEERCYWTKQFLESWFITSNTAITPREINKAINRIVGLLLQWGFESISFEAIVYFTINHQTIEERFDEIVGAGESPLKRLVPDWQRELAALHYGVSVDHAGQVLMTQPLRSAFASGEVAALEPYREIAGYGDTFGAVVANLPKDADSGTPSFSVITNAAKMLANECEQRPEVWQGPAWRSLVEAFNSLDSIPTTTDYDVRAAYFLPFLSPIEASDFVTTVERAGDKILAAEKGTVSSIRQLGRFTGQLIAKVELLGVEPPVFDYNSEPEGYLSRLAILAEFPSVQSRLRTNINHAEIVAGLNSRLTTDDQAGTVPKLLELLTSKRAKLIIDGTLEQAAEVISAAEQIIRNTGGQTSPFKASLLTIVAASRLRSQAVEALERLVQDGTIANKLAQCADGDAEKPLAIMLAALVLNEVSVASPIGSHWGALFSKYAKLVEETNSVLDWLCEDSGSPLERISAIYDAHYQTMELARALAEDRVRRGELGRLYPAKVLAELDKYTRLVSWRARDRLTALCLDYKKFSAAVVSVDFSPGVVEAATRLRNSGGEAAVEFLSKIAQRVQKSTQAEWKTAIVGQSELLSLAIGPDADSTMRFGVNSNLLGALIEVAKVSELASSLSQTRWFDLAGLLTQPARKRAFTTLREQLSLFTPPQLTKLLKAGGARFVGEANLFADPTWSIDAIVLPLSRSAKGRLWLRDQRSELKHMCSIADPDQMQKLHHMVSANLKSKDAEVRHWGEMVQTEWGMV